MRWSSVVSVCVLGLGLAACRNDDPGEGGTDSDGSSSDTDMLTTSSTSTTSTSGMVTTQGSDTTGEPMCVAADCDDGNACTIDGCSDDGQCVPLEAVVSSACRPEIVVDSPARAATLEDPSPLVTVTGTVTSPAGDIAWLEINGEDVTVEPDGSFSHDVMAVTGGNILVFETEDVFEVNRRRVQSFLWSTDYRLPTTPDVDITPEGIGIYLDQQTIDDGNRSTPPDDLATLLFLALDSSDLSALVPQTPIYTNQTAAYDVYVTDLTYDSTSLTASSINGGIQLVAGVNGIDGTLLFDCTSGGNSLPCFNADASGDFSATSAVATADLAISVDAQNELQITTVNVTTQINGLTLNAADPCVNPFGCIDIQGIVTLVEPFVASLIEDLLEQEIQNNLGPALTSALSGLAPESGIQFPNLADDTMPIDVLLATDFLGTDFQPGGGVITLRGGGYPASTVTPYENLGIPTRANCGAGGGGITLPRTAELEIGVHDDLINQLLNAAWRGGLLEFQMPDELLGADNAIFSDLEIHVSAMLAPTASDCATDGVARAHVGDVRVNGSLLLDDEPLSFTSYSSMFANLELTSTTSGVAISIADVEQIETEMTINEDDQFINEAALTTILEEQLVDGLFAAIAEGGLGEINIPPIDLSTQLGLPPGTAAVQVTTNSVGRQPGTIVISGEL